MRKKTQIEIIIINARKNKCNGKNVREKTQGTKNRKEIKWRKKRKRKPQGENARKKPKKKRKEKTYGLLLKKKLIAFQSVTMVFAQFFFATHCIESVPMVFAGHCIAKCPIIFSAKCPFNKREATAVHCRSTHLIRPKATMFTGNEMKRA